MSEYTPTVWRTGDVITAEKLNKIEEGIAGAESVTVESLSVTENGTYSEEGKAYSPVTVSVPSDFSTAEVTIKNTNQNLSEANFSFPYLSDGALSGGTSDLMLDFVEGDVVRDISLYNGKANIILSLAATGSSPSVALSGGISGTLPEFMVTGDCTIIIS